MTEERLKEIEARAAALDPGLYGGELDRVVEQDIPELVAALREAYAIVKPMVESGAADSWGGCAGCGVIDPGISDHKPGCFFDAAVRFIRTWEEATE